MLLQPHLLVNDRGALERKPWKKITKAVLWLDFMVFFWISFSRGFWWGWVRLSAGRSCAGTVHTPAAHWTESTPALIPRPYPARLLWTSCSLVCTLIQPLQCDLNHLNHLDLRFLLWSINSQFKSTPCLVSTFGSTCSYYKHYMVYNVKIASIIGGLGGRRSKNIWCIMMPNWIYDNNNNIMGILPNWATSLSTVPAPNFNLTSFSPWISFNCF